MSAPAPAAEQPATGRCGPPPRRPCLAIAVGLFATLAAVLLPFAPVTLTQATVQWPASGAQAGSTTAFFTPPRPAELVVTAPCSAVRAAAGHDRAATVFTSGGAGGGLAIQAGGGRLTVQLAGRVVVSDAVQSSADCGVEVSAGSAGVVVRHGGVRTELAAEPVPEVTAFRTDLDPAAAGGLSATARTASPWQSSPTPAKRALIVAAVLAAAAALLLLRVRGGVRVRHGRAKRGVRVAGPRLVDAAVLAVLGGWAVIGPITDDDGFAATIARNVAATGEAGNYYRWWSASETPFALTQQLLAPLTEVSLAPLWLRLPSTLLGVATWFLVSRGVLGAALPGLAATGRVRLLAAVCLLAAWLPFDLGTRPEPYVACGSAAVLALLLRARTVAGVGGAALVAALTLPASPAGVVVLAPVVALAPRILRLLRAGGVGRTAVIARMALLGGVAAVGLIAVFADQTWYGLTAATELHNRFGPSLAWYEEGVRYGYLLGTDSQGSAAKRLPVLLALVLVATVAVLLFQRRAGRHTPALRVTATSAAAGFALLVLLPSKWSHHFGALAGLIAPFLAIAIVVLVRTASRDGPAWRWLGAVAGATAAVAAAVAFAGPNEWFQPINYPVPWAEGPIRPLGLPLDSPLLWLGILGVVAGMLQVARGSKHARAVLTAAPALITMVATATGVAVLLVSFGAASLREPGGYTLAAANLDGLTGRAVCGIADHVEVLPGGAAGTTTPDPPTAGDPPPSPAVRLSDYLRGRGPVLVDWPIAFLLPCQTDIPGVSHGIAQAPALVVQPPRRDRAAGLASDPGQGGSFVGIRTSGRLIEIPTLLAGGTDDEWGHLARVDYGMPRDRYTVRLQDTVLAGWTAP